jgi:tetratricopeptide (TPR) repeat protein
MEKKKILEYALLAFVLLSVFAVYTQTMFPAFKGDDSPETIAASFTLGIMHPPGYPLYTMLGKIASFVPAASPAFRVNLLSAALSLFVLLVLYFILTRYIFKLFGFNQGVFTWALGLGFLYLLAFSYIFWNQSMEAKGGIYMLNLFLLSLLIYLSLNLSGAQNSEQGKGLQLETRNSKPGTESNMKILYLISYIYGLSLANHWPSMIIIAPVLVYIFFRHRNEFNKNRLSICGLAFVVGISAYLYLCVRAPGQPLMNWGDPSTPGNFFDVILRKGYSGEIVPATAYVFGYHIKYFLNFFAANYGLLWILSLPGAYFLYKEKREWFWMLLAAALITVVMVVFYNRTKEEVIWLMGIFLMPVEFIVLILISAGAGAALARVKTLSVKYICLLVLCGLVILTGINNSAKNRRSTDYIAYDESKNLQSGISPGAYYIPEHDMYLFPMYYFQNVLKQRADIKLFSLPFLMTEWGVRQARAKYGYFPGKPGDILFNLAGLIGTAFRDKVLVYRDYTSPAFDALKLPFFLDFSGLVKRISPVPASESPRMYSLFFFRGIYGRQGQAEENIEILSRYLIFMSNHAEKLLLSGRPSESLAIFEKAMLIPVPKLLYNMYFKMAQCHFELKDKAMALYCLKKAIEDKADFYQASEMAAQIYSEAGDVYGAAKILESSISVGNTNSAARQYVDGARAFITRNELLLTEAERCSRGREKDINRAEKIYLGLLKANYRPAEVWLRLGQIYFDNRQMDKAMKALIECNKRELNSEAYFLEALIYKEEGKLKESSDTALEGVLRFPENKELRELFGQLK